jgi:hypothetical protein
MLCLLRKLVCATKDYEKGTNAHSRFCPDRSFPRQTHFHGTCRRLALINDDPASELCELCRVGP